MTQAAATADTPTQDSFFNGKFAVLQTNDGGHRAGLDALLLSACVSQDFTGRLADYGAGSGVAGMAVACRSFTAEVDLIESNEEIATLANRSLKLPINRKMHGRVKVTKADVSLSGREREDAGLVSTNYDMVIMNPPFNNSAHRPSPIAARQEAHVMGEGGLDPWLRSAAATLKGNGRVALIYRPSSLGQVLAAFQGRFGSASIIPVYPKEGEEANRILVLARKGGRGPISILPGFVVHEKDGRFTDRAQEIFAGNAVLPQIGKV